MSNQKTFGEEEQYNRILPKIKCKICGKEYERITNTHLKKHGISMCEYRERFPDALMISDGYRRKLTENHADFSDENNPMYGKTGEKNGMYGRTGEKHPMFGRHHTVEAKEKIGKGISGEKHGNYKGGISYLPYCIKFDEDLKERVRDFFGRCCYVCRKNETDNGQRLSVHQRQLRQDGLL